MWILYQLSYQGNPENVWMTPKGRIKWPNDGGVRDVSYTNCTEKHLRAHPQTHPARQKHQGVDLSSYTYKFLVCYCTQSLS